MDPMLLLLLATANMEISATILAAASGTASDDDAYELLARLMQTIEGAMNERSKST